MHRISELFSPSPHPDQPADPSPPHLTIVEARVLAGDVLLYALRRAAPEIRIDLVCSLDEVVRRGAGALLYSFVNRACDEASTRMALARIKEQCPGLSLIVLTDTASEALGELMIRYGVNYWVPACLGFDALAAAVRAACASDTAAPAIAPSATSDPGPTFLAPTSSPRPLGLTDKERSILSLIHEGKCNKVIAFELSCSESTVKVHISNMMRKLRLHNRTQLALVYRESMEHGGRKSRLSVGPAISAIAGEIGRTSTVNGRGPHPQG